MIIIVHVRTITLAPFSNFHILAHANTDFEPNMKDVFYVKI